MSKKVRSAKGDVVDFDLLKIKQSMGKTPKPLNVQAREEFIERKMRRRVRKAAQPVSSIVEPDKTEQTEVAEPPKEKRRLKKTTKK